MWRKGTRVCEDDFSDGFLWGRTRASLLSCPVTFWRWHLRIIFSWNPRKMTMMMRWWRGQKGDAIFEEHLVCDRARRRNKVEVGFYRRRRRRVFPWFIFTDSFLRPNRDYDFVFPYPLEDEHAFSTVFYVYITSFSNSDFRNCPIAKIFADWSTWRRK